METLQCTVALLTTPTSTSHLPIVLAHLYPHVHMYTPSLTCTHPHLHMYTPSLTCTPPSHPHVHAFTSTCTRSHSHAHLYPHVHMYTPSLTCILTHPHIYTLSHTQSYTFTTCTLSGSQYIVRNTDAPCTDLQLPCVHSLKLFQVCLHLQHRLCLLLTLGLCRLCLQIFHYNYHCNNYSDLIVTSLQ